jgi:hypothetical protein
MKNISPSLLQAIISTMSRQLVENIPQVNVHHSILRRQTPSQKKQSTVWLRNLKSALLNQSNQELYSCNTLWVPLTPSTAGFTLECLFPYLLHGSNSAIKRYYYYRLFTKDRDEFHISTFYPHPLSVKPYVYWVMTRGLFL